ncbi:MAG TPA: DUF3048 domain-containing protein [Candidatus Saccharimonadales bacterium]|nr:DUF3048 domain-containing protein [Candidatus Saccharimonadales bacterium]
MIDDFRRPGNNPQPRPRAKLEPLPPRDFVRPREAVRPHGILPEPVPQRKTAQDVHATRTGLQPAVEPAFRTPEQVSATAGQSTQDNRIKLLGSHATEKLLSEHASLPWHKRLLALLTHKPSRKQAIIMSVVALLAMGSVAADAFTRDKPQPIARKPVTAKTVAKPAPKPITSPLTGLVVTSEQQARPVTGVMIENSADARPQSGLKEAGVVFEAISEYGVTRFLALYQESAPGNIGPVRSARPYFLDWAQAFDANYAHVGGSPEALQLIKDRGMRDLDQFFNAGAYRRVRERFAPHNMYTTMDQLTAAATARGYGKSTFTPLPRKDKEQPAKTPTVPTAKAINFGISGAFYNVRYDYDPATNSYKRVMGGSPHIDNESKAQLDPKVVVALAMPYSLMADGYHSQYNTVGSGNMLVFQDGSVTPGTWSKADPKAQFEFKDGAGAAIKLNPGQTWITVLGDITKATYAP